MTSQQYQYEKRDLELNQQHEQQTILLIQEENHNHFLIHEENQHQLQIRKQELNLEIQRAMIANRLMFRNLSEQLSELMIEKFG